jgi:hypothetical protein
LGAEIADMHDTATEYVSRPAMSVPALPAFEDWPVWSTNYALSTSPVRTFLASSNPGDLVWTHHIIEINTILSGPLNPIASAAAAVACLPLCIVHPDAPSKRSRTLIAFNEGKYLFAHTSRTVGSESQCYFYLKSADY